MDEQLIAFLNERFEEARRHLDTRFDAARRDLATSLDQRFEAAEGRLVASLDQRFEETQRRLEASFDQRFDAVQQRLEASFDQRFEDAKRHFGVIAESLRNDVRLIAEGHRGLERELRELRRENDTAHREIIATVRLSHAGLDRRVTGLESRADRIEERLDPGTE
jgi:exonuclease VII large subunit